VPNAAEPVEMLSGPNTGAASNSPPLYSSTCPQRAPCGPTIVSKKRKSIPAPVPTFDELKDEGIALLIELSESDSRSANYYRSYCGVLSHARRFAAALPAGADVQALFLSAIADPALKVISDAGNEARVSGVVSVLMEVPFLRDATEGADVPAEDTSSPSTNSASETSAELKPEHKASTA
jgi:hypothetical protein